MYPAQSSQWGRLRCAVLRSTGVNILDAAINDWLDRHQDVTVVEIKLHPEILLAFVLYYQEEKTGDRA